ncbi:MAG: DUF1178 family protein [Alphaproteobacteria bacterium]|nr:DUF1178 family protein [Alphaproteobacteria bacterium]
MISFNLKCDNDHEFEGWFKDSKAFEKQQESGLLECGFCGSKDVHKALSTPNISTSRSQEKSRQELQTKIYMETRAALGEIRKKVEENCENVGERFAEEARKIHYGEVEEKGIYGNATPEEVKELTEEGVQVATLPWVDDKAN